MHFSGVSMDDAYMHSIIDSLEFTLGLLVQKPHTRCSISLCSVVVPVGCAFALNRFFVPNDMTTRAPTRSYYFPSNRDPTHICKRKGRLSISANQCRIFWVLILQALAGTQVISASSTPGTGRYSGHFPFQVPLDTLAAPRLGSKEGTGMAKIERTRKNDSPVPQVAT